MTQTTLTDLKNELQKIKDAIETQKSLKGKMPDDLLDSILSGLKSQQEGLVRQITELTGSGAIASDHSVAAGKRGVGIGGDNAGNIFTGNKNTFIQLTTPENDDGQSPSEVNHYLKTLAEKCDVLDLAAIDETCSADDVIRVSDVFTSLNLKTLRFPGQSIEDAVCGKRDEAFQRREDREEPVPVQAVEAAGEMHRLVILGQPGGGKTTLVNYIGSRLALRRLRGGLSAGAADERLDELAGFEKNDTPLPVRIILRHFAAWIPGECKRGSAGLVWNYLEYMLNENWGCRCYETLCQMLLDEGGIVFFDGLDEVREKDEDAKRSVIKEAVEDFAGSAGKCRIIITCRKYAYTRSDDWRLSEKMFPVTELALFSMEQIKMFARTWYKILGHRNEWNEAKQQAEAEDLVIAVDAQPHLKELAQYPLLMTLMAQVHGRVGTLPKDRADLYRRAVDLLLEHWDNRIVRDGGVCKRQSGEILRLGIQRDTLLSVLQELAFSAHERQEMETDRSEKCADISKLDLLEALKAELESYDRANEVLEYIHERSGLLTTQDNKTYMFPHRTFQEYLTATYLMKQSAPDVMLQERVHRDINWWREVFLLAAGHSKDFPSYVSNLVDALLPRSSNGVVKTDQAQYARLAAQALVETDFLGHVKKEKGTDRFLRVYEEIQQWLVDALEANETLKPVDRVKSGRMLALLGDPRKEVMTLDHMKFCLVSAGDFYMGDEEERHLNDCLDYDYWMGLHPVSNAQFDMFVQAGGYGEERYWREAAEAGYWISGKFKGRYDSEWRPSPDKYRAPFNFPNHPVVGVSWYESLAFVRWLTDKWKDNGFLDEGWKIRLPSEAEWEKAARGGVEVFESTLIVSAFEKLWQKKLGDNIKKNTVREYPWGDKIDENRANYDDIGIGSTSAMGCFFSGASPFGCLDMAGNVREWTRSLWGKDLMKSDFNYPYDPDDGRENLLAKNEISRVLRGGAFGDYFDSSGGLRCADRDSDSPGSRGYFMGFRCACAPVPLKSDSSDL